ncbi:MAG: MogA/MoaB family molybdenum cofactor biosynthesis protein [Actinobacteria bacterium]|nr:MogA/MoaB family molybdenum cofactor biosynthesis protein [Actinomycetota bacterium]
MKELTAAIITASNRAALGIYLDESGEVLSQGLNQLGFFVISKVVIPDDVEKISLEIASALASRVNLLVTTGGTGISPTDVTPEATAPHIERLLPGVSEALRAFGREKTPLADLSRGLVGVNGQTVIINLPGSPNGVRDGLVIIGRVVPHIISQLAGQDHS